MTFTCPHCLLVSQNPFNTQYAYCVHCHRTGDEAALVPEVLTYLRHAATDALRRLASPVGVQTLERDQKDRLAQARAALDRLILSLGQHNVLPGAGQNLAGSVSLARISGISGRFAAEPKALIAA